MYWENWMRYLPVKRAQFFVGSIGNFEEAKLIQICFDMDVTEAVNATKKRGERATLLFFKFYFFMAARQNWHFWSQNKTSGQRKF